MSAALSPSKLHSSTFSPLLLLRSIFNPRRSLNGSVLTVSKTIGLVSASYTAIIYSDSLRSRSSYSSMATSASGGDDVRSRSHQSPLASQRAKEQGESEATQAGRFARMFPLGAKEGFNQWVCSARRKQYALTKLTASSGLVCRQQ